MFQFVASKTRTTARWRTVVGLPPSVIVRLNVSGLAGVSDGDVDPAGEDARVRGVGRLHEVVDGAGRALDVPGDDVAGDVARDVDGVAAEAADDAGKDTGLRAEYVDRVVALERVDLEH